MTSIPVEAPIVDDAILKISGTGALRACLLNNRRPICALVAGDGLGGSEGQRQGERQEEPAEEGGHGGHGLEVRVWGKEEKDWKKGLIPGKMVKKRKRKKKVKKEK